MTVTRPPSKDLILAAALAFGSPRMAVSPRSRSSAVPGSLGVSSLQYLDHEALVHTPRFYAIDCRANAPPPPLGRFATAHRLECDLETAIHDPDIIERLFATFKDVKGKVHICLIGEGSVDCDARDRAVGSSVDGGFASPEERAALENLVLLFLKNGFPHVSVLTGGFASAHRLLTETTRRRDEALGAMTRAKTARAAADEREPGVELSEAVSIETEAEAVLRSLPDLALTDLIEVSTETGAAGKAVAGEDMLKKAVRHKK